MHVESCDRFGGGALLKNVPTRKPIMVSNGRVRVCCVISVIGHMPCITLLISMS